VKKVYLFLATVLMFGSITAQNKTDIEKYSSKKTQSGFVMNKGQIVDQNQKTNTDVIYLLSSGNGMNVQLKKNSFSYDTYKAEAVDYGEDPLAINMQPNKKTAKEYRYNFHRVDIELVGANTNPEIIALQPSNSYRSYYNALTPESKATNLHNYKKIIYQNIYPGIDMIFEAQASKEKSFEYSFIVHPGADANQIKLQYKGANETRLLDNKINIDVINGRFSENIPASWIKETNTNLNVTYKNIQKDVYSFNIPSYSNSQTLIIDPNPNLDWATYFGGSGDETGTGIVCNANGDAIITGFTNSADAIATTGAYQSTIGGGAKDAFIAKFDNNGTIMWATYFGGTGDDQGTGVTCDVNGNIFVTGFTNSTDLVFPAGAYQAAIGGGQDAFVAKFNAAGAIQWGTYYGGSGDDRGNSITCDPTGNVFIIGTTNSSTSIATPTGAYQAAFGGGNTDAFIVKFNTSGARQWATYYGGSGDDMGTGIACDGTGDAFITGTTNSATGLSSTGAHQAAFGGGTYDAYLAKFTPTGTRQWATYLGGSGDDEGTGVACDVGGNVLITGFTNSPNNIASTSTYQSTIGGGIDAYVAKFKTNGTFIFGTYYGGLLDDYASGITTDQSGTYISIAGYTNSTNSIASNSSYQSVFGGGTTTGDAFVVKFDNSDLRKWGTYYGGEGEDKATAVAFDGSGNVFITGQTTSTDDIATTGAYQTTLGGPDDAFIARFSTCDLPVDAGTIYGPAPICLPVSGKLAYLVAPITYATQYVWTFEGNDTTSASNSDSVNVSGYTVGQTLTISVYGKNACGIGASKTLQIQLNSTPPPPVISWATGPDSINLVSSAATGNQWYVGTASLGSNQTCVASSNGDYHATVTVNGCTSPWSNILTVTHVGIQENQINNGTKVYPNPVSNQLIIETEATNNKLYYELYNSIGQVIHNGYVFGKTIIETTNLSSGVYLLKLDNGKTIDYKKIVKD